MKLEQIKIAITLDNGDLSVMSFLTVGRGNVLPPLAAWIDEKEHPGWWRREPTDAAILDELVRTFPDTDIDGKARPQPVRFRRIQESDIPADRTYRAAWKDGGAGAIEHDMPKARAIQVGRVRFARNVKLEQLDRDWMRATGQARTADAKAIEASRQELRDLPATMAPWVDSAATTEALKAVWSPLLD